MKLCEPAAATRPVDQTMDRARDFAEGVGKTPRQPRRGRIRDHAVDHGSGAMEAIALVESGAWLAEDVDTACRLDSVMRWVRWRPGGHDRRGHHLHRDVEHLRRQPGREARTRSCAGWSTSSPETWGATAEGLRPRNASHRRHRLRRALHLLAVVTAFSAALLTETLGSIRPRSGLGSRFVHRALLVAVAVHAADLED